jgi:hypothetical protein
VEAARVHGKYGTAPDGAHQSGGPTLPEDHLLWAQLYAYLLVGIDASVSSTFTRRSRADVHEAAGLSE